MLCKIIEIENLLLDYVYALKRFKLPTLLAQKRQYFFAVVN